MPREIWPAPCACPWAPPLSPPVPRCALPWPARCPACAPSPPSWITRRASCCLCSCGSVTPGGECAGARGRACRVRPLGKGLGGNGLGGLVCVWVGLVWARYFAPSLPTAAAAAAAGEAPLARAGPVTCACVVLGAAACPDEAVAWLAGAAVATPRAPSSLPCAAAAALGDAPGSCAGATPRVGGVLGAAVGAAAWLAGAAVSAPRASGVLPRGGAAGLAAWVAGAVTSAGSGTWVDGPVLAEAAWGRPAGGLTSIAASASLHSLRSVGVSPAHSGETGERERDRRWWRSSRWGEPSESDITFFLVGMRGGRCALPTTSYCFSVVPWAVLRRAVPRGGGKGGGGGGSAAASAPHGWGPVAIHRHWEGRRGSHAAHASRHSSQSGAGLRTLAPRGSSGGAGGGRTRWTPVPAVTPCIRRKVCDPSRAAGAGTGGAGRGCRPVEVGGGDPQDPLRVPSGRDDGEDQGDARALLSEDLPPVVGTPGPGEGGVGVGVA